MVENTTISDLSKVIRSISDNTGILSDIANVCAVIKKLKLQSKDAVIVDEKSTIIKNVCDHSLKTIFTSLDNLNTIKTKLDLSSLNIFKNNFDILTGYINILHNFIFEFNTKFNKKQGDDLMKNLQNLTSYITTTNNLFSEKGSVIESLNNIKPININHTNIRKLFNDIVEYFDIVVNSLKDISDISTDDIKQLIIMYSEDAIKGLSSIFSHIKSIVESFNVIVDIKKNPFINPGKLLFVKLTIHKVFDSIIDISDYMCNQLEILDKKLINKGKKYDIDTLKNQSSIFSHIKSIVESFNDIVDIKKNPFINPGKLLYVKLTIRKVFGSIVEISDYMCNQLEILDKKLNKEKIKNINDTTESIHKIIQNITNILKDFISLPLLILTFTLAAIVIIPGLILLQSLLLIIIARMQAFRLIGKFTSTIKDATINIKTLIQDLKSIFSDIVKLSLLSILLVPAILIIAAAMPIIVIGVTVIVLGVFAISKLFNLINNLGLKRAKRASNRILLLMANITLICISIILFAITIIPIMNILIAGILAIVLIFTMLALAIKVMSIASKLMRFKDFLAISLTLLAVSLIILALIGISMLLVLLQEQAKQIDVLTIVLFMVGFIVFVAILTALGYACIAAAPILIPAAIAIVLLAAVTLIVVGSLLLVAYLLNKLSEISLDSEAIKNTVNVVFETANDIINAIFQNPREEKEGTEKESWWSSALKWLGDSTVGKLFKSLLTVIYLAQIIATVYLIKWIADCLNQLQNVKLDRIKVNEGVDIVLSTANSIIKKITTYKNDDFKKAHKNLTKYDNVMKVMVNIQNRLNKLSKYENLVDGCMNLITVVSRFNDTFNKIDEKKTVNAVKEYTNFLKQINSMDLNKLETTVKMFGEMARFSESINGNFESLADALNENIAPLLEELKELISSIPEKTAQANTNSQQNNTGNNTQANTNSQQNNTGNNTQANTNSQQIYADIDNITNELISIKTLFEQGDAIVQVKTS